MLLHPVCAICCISSLHLEVSTFQPPCILVPKTKSPRLSHKSHAPLSPTFASHSKMLVACFGHKRTSKNGSTMKTHPLIQTKHLPLRCLSNVFLRSAKHCVQRVHALYGHVWCKAPSSMKYYRNNMSKWFIHIQNMLFPALPIVIHGLEQIARFVGATLEFHVGRVHNSVLEWNSLRFWFYNANAIWFQKLVSIKNVWGGSHV